MNKKVKEMIGGCCVCSDERGWSENPLVYCDGAGCNVAVHQACYGIVQVPTGPWFCKKCESQERVARVKCELCPQKDGALKRTDAGGWCHVVCALYIPEAWFANVQTMEPIVLSAVPQDRFSKTCYICEEQKRDTKATAGACMQCNRNGCKQHFHVTCAQAQGLLCEVTGSYENVKYCGYCSHHNKKVKHQSNVKTIPAFKPIPNDNETPDSSPEKNPPIIEEDSKKQAPPLPPPPIKEVKSPQVDQSVSSTSDSLPLSSVVGNKQDQSVPGSVSRSYSEMSDISSAVSPSGEANKSPCSNGEQIQEPSSTNAPCNVKSPPWTNAHSRVKSPSPMDTSSVKSPSSTNAQSTTGALSSSGLTSSSVKPSGHSLSKMLQEGSATSSTENLFEMEVGLMENSSISAGSSRNVTPSLPQEAPAIIPKRQRNSEKAGKKSVSKKTKSNVISSTVAQGSNSTRDVSSKKNTKKNKDSSSTASKAASNSANVTSGLPGHHDYCGSIFGGSPYFQSLSAPGCVSLPSFSPSQAYFAGCAGPSANMVFGRECYYDAPNPVNGLSHLVHPPKMFPSLAAGVTSNQQNNSQDFPLSMEQLLEKQWEQGAQFLMEQGEHFDISGLLNCLHRLKEENQNLEEQVRELTSRRDHLMAVNARLSLPLSLFDPLSSNHKGSSFGSLEDISSPDDVQTPKLGVTSLATVKIPANQELMVEDILSPVENPSLSSDRLKAMSIDGPSVSTSYVFNDQACPPQPLMYSIVNPPPPLSEVPCPIKQSTSSSALSSVSTMPPLENVQMPLLNSHRRSSPNPPVLHRSSLDNT